MIRSAVIALIGQRLGKRTTLDDVILSEMDLVQQTVLERNGRLQPWFLETEVATAGTTAEEERVALPTDFVMEKEEGGLWLYLANEEDPWVRLNKTDYQNMIQGHGDTPGQPEEYSLGGLYMRLRPIPDAEYVLKMIYYAAQPLPSALAVGGENVWLKYAPDLVIAEVCKLVAEKHIQDFELANTFAPDIQRAWDRLHVETEAQQHTNRSYSMGDAP